MIFSVCHHDLIGLSSDCRAEKLVSTGTVVLCDKTLRLSVRRRILLLIQCATYTGDLDLCFSLSLASSDKGDWERDHIKCIVWNLVRKMNRAAYGSLAGQR